MMMVNIPVVNFSFLFEAVTFTEMVVKMIMESYVNRA